MDDLPAATYLVCPIKEILIVRQEPHFGSAVGLQERDPNEADVLITQGTTTAVRGSQVSQQTIFDAYLREVGPQYLFQLGIALCGGRRHDPIWEVNPMPDCGCVGTQANLLHEYSTGNIHMVIGCTAPKPLKEVLRAQTEIIEATHPRLVGAVSSVLLTEEAED